MLGRRVERHLHGIGAKWASTERRLGYQYGLGKRISRTVNRARWATFKGRLRRVGHLAAVPGMQGKTGKLVQALAMGPMYGTEVQRLAGPQMRTLRATLAKRSGWGVTRGKPGLIWAMARKGQDPLARQGWRAMERYHREWFGQAAQRPPEGLLRPEVIGRAYRAAAAGPTRRQGPVENALQAGREAGWSFRTAAEVITRRNGAANLAEAGPAYLQTIFMQDVQGHQAQQAFTAMRAASGEEDRGDGRDRDWPVIRAVLFSTGSRSLDWKAKKALRQFVCGEHITKSKLFEWGLTESPHCLFCNKEVDTVEHRLFSQCGDSAIVAARQEARLQHWYDRSGDGEEKRGRRNGLFPEPEFRRGGDKEEEVKWLVKPAGGTLAGYFDPKDGPIGIDGSCIDGRYPWASAAGAAVQCDPATGDILKGVAFRVPAEWIQTAAAGEQWAALSADELSGAAATAVTDCAAVVSYHQRRELIGDSHKAAWAGFWRQFLGSLAQVKKVKSHRDEEQARSEGPESHLWWQLNDAADRAAKSMAESGLPGAGGAAYILPLLHSERKARAAWLRGIAAILSAWPAGTSFVQAGRAARAGLRGHLVCAEALVLFHSHTILFVLHRQRWVCIACGQSSHRRHGNIAGSTCKKPEGGGEHDMLSRSAEARALGHDPKWARVEGGGLMVVCLRCGSVSEARSVGLAKVCAGSTQSAGTAHRLSRFKRGDHPRRPGVKITQLATGRDGDSHSGSAAGGLGTM